MSEEWGNIILKPSPEVIDAFTTKNYAKAITLLAEQTHIGLTILGSIPLRFEKVVIQDGYLFLSYEGGAWSTVSEQLIQSKSSMEYYAQHYNEYGLETYASITPNHAPIYLQYDQEGDDEPDISPRDQWIKTIPQQVLSLFPQWLSDENDD